MYVLGVRCGPNVTLYTSNWIRICCIQYGIQCYNGHLVLNTGYMAKADDSLPQGNDIKLFFLNTCNDYPKISFKDFRVVVLEAGSVYKDRIHEGTRVYRTDIFLV